MSTTAKAIELAHELADILKKRTGAVVTEGFDASTDGPHPTLLVGPGTIGSASAFIRIKPTDWPLSLNVIGLAGQVYATHTLQLVTEANPTAGAGADILTPQLVLSILGESTKLATRVEWYNSANGNAPEVSDIIVGNLVAKWESDLYWGTLASS